MGSKWVFTVLFLALIAATSYATPTTLNTQASIRQNDGAAADGKSYEEEYEDEGFDWTPDQLKSGFFLHLVSFSSASDEQWNENVVWEQGVLTGPFLACTDQMVSDPEQGPNVCHVVGENTESLYAEFFFEADVESYKFEKPIVKTLTGGAGIQPEVTEYFVDDLELEGTFTVQFKCSAAQAGKIFPIQISVKILDDTFVTFNVLKKCGGGAANPNVKFGYINSNEDLVDFTPETKLAVGPLTATTSIYMYSENTDTELDFLAPVLKSSDENAVAVTLRGSANGGTLTQDPTFFEVHYDCLSKGKSTITLTVDLAPWDAMPVSWVKDCGTKEHSDVKIGTTYGSDDVLAGGKPATSFDVNFKSLSEFDDSHFSIPAEQGRVSFYVSNGETGVAGEPMYFGRVSVTRSNPAVLSALIDKSPSPASLGPSGGFLEAGDTAQMDMRFICKRAGQSNVIVTIPTVGGNILEFGFKKVCKNPRKVKESGFLVTASSYFYIFIILGALAAGAVLFGGKKMFDKIKEKNAGYAPAPTR